MHRLLIPGCMLLALRIVAVAGVVRGTLLNDDDPYFVKGDGDGSIYKAEWYYGSILFYEGDRVILTSDYGDAKMIDDTTDETADVLVEEVSTGYPTIIARPKPLPNVTPVPAPSYATPGSNSEDASAQTPSSTPTPALQYNDTKWSDGRLLTHPERFRKAYVINLRTGDTLKLRVGPGTKYPAVTEIPANATTIRVFDRDELWDGDTWWCPVEWHGFRGYAGRHYLQIEH